MRTGENRLYLYQSGRLTRTFPVATGMPAYPTPTGEFRITLKRFRPTWVNPSPRVGWGASMPAMIPPGPNNPLGTRALNVSAPGIRFHGTPAAGSIGYNASHGCIRMRMPDVEALFPLVPTGAAVVITRGGGSSRWTAGGVRVHRRRRRGRLTGRPRRPDAGGRGLDGRNRGWKVGPANPPRRVRGSRWRSSTSPPSCPSRSSNR
ncbi:MAG TPA: L,D-transpeptidase [Mycobacteriales bacterium]|nr:L,D-transpeptidase [Mycobacteriales bacterium]